MKPVSMRSRKVQPQSRIFLLGLLLPTSALPAENDLSQKPRPEVVESDMRAIQLLMQEVGPDEEMPAGSTAQPRPQEGSLDQVKKDLTGDHPPASSFESGLGADAKVPLSTPAAAAAPLREPNSDERELSSAQPLVSPNERTVAAAGAAASVTSTDLQTSSLQSVQENGTPPTTDSGAEQNTSAADEATTASVSTFFQSDAAPKLDQELWKSTAAIFGVLLLIALGAIHLLRRRATGDAPGAPSAKPLQLISTLPVGPKRQILLIRVRDQEVAVASTESGITVLSPHFSLETSVSPDARNTTGGRGVVQEIQPVSLTGSARETSSRIPLLARKSAAPLAQEGRVLGETRSEILRKAVETIEQRRTSAAHSRVQANTESSPTATQQAQAPAGDRVRAMTEATSTQSASQSRSRAGTLPTRKGNTRSTETAQPAGQNSSLAPLKKFLTNQYGRSAAEQGNLSGKPDERGGQRKSSMESAPSKGSSETVANGPTSSQSDNVAQLIREKLKQMKSIN